MSRAALESVSAPRQAFLALCALLGACGATGGSSPAPRSEAVVRPDVLPAANQRVIEAWKKGGAAWELEREEILRDPELARFAVDNLFLSMVQAYERSRLSNVVRGAGPFERAQDELVALSEHSTPVLAQLLSVRDGIVSFLAAQTLERIGASATPAVLPFADDGVAETRRRALELLGRLPLATDEPRVLERVGKHVAEDPEWIVRAQAARTLGARAALATSGGRTPSVGYVTGVLVRALADPDATVAGAAATALGDLADPRAIPKLVDGLERAGAAGRPIVVEALQASLARLAGDPVRRDPAAWRVWWRENGDRVAPPVPLAPR